MAGGRRLGGRGAGDGLLFRLGTFGFRPRPADAGATAAVLGGPIYGGSIDTGTALAALLVGYLQQGLQMVGIPNRVERAVRALLVVVVMGRSLSLHREWVRATGGVFSRINNRSINEIKLIVLALAMSVVTAQAADRIAFIPAGRRRLLPAAATARKRRESAGRGCHL